MARIVGGSVTDSIPGAGNGDWRTRIVGHGEEAPDQLLANPGNWRIHGKAQQEALAGVLDEVGWVQDVIVNQRTGHMIDAHLRVTLAMRHNEPMIPVVYVDLAPEEEALVLATLDPLSAMATTDAAQYDALLRDVETQSAAVQEMLAKTAADAGLYLAPPEAPEPQVDRAEELREQWQTERGQVWEIPSKVTPGKAHRIMCGDSTAEADVARLLAGAKPLLMVTDPPYGVKYDPLFRQEALGTADRRAGAVANDDRADWGDAWALFSGDVFYCWHAMRKATVVGESIEAAGFVIRAEIVWTKSYQAPFGRGHYHAGHESCWYAVRRGAQARWCGPDNESTVWAIGLDDTALGGHGTQKPIECVARPIRNHEGDVYDPFLGSGTTAVAAEQTGRICHGMELEPRYTAVALQRLSDMGLEPRPTDA